MRPWPAAGKAALVAALAGLAILAQELTIRVDVNLVRLLATVKDEGGRLIGGLDRGDFEVLDNGAPQEIAIFERQTEQPLSIALLIDISGSTAKELKYQTDSVRRFLGALFSEGNPADAVALYTFNYEVTKLAHFTRNRSTLEKMLPTLKAEAGTSLYDAVFLASEDLEQREGRKVLLVVTDGGDTTSDKDFHAALEAAQLADAVIYSILVVPIKGNVGRNVGGENALTTLGERTGGRVFTPSVGPAMDAAFAEVIRELRTQYLIGFYPRNVPLTKDRFHRLDVRTSRPGLRVSARTGYYGEAESVPGRAPDSISIVPKPAGRQER
ncbi:MAG: VWA domain-containing protein [Bryobacterales bacterium]|nr:VWA domain-containing protein [Bryobacterales bacterium]